jgi:integrase/recombinase XerD
MGIMIKNVRTKKYQITLEGFDNMIVAKGYRQSGKTYQNNAKEFLAFVEDKGIFSPERIRAEDILHYFEFISQRNAMRGFGTLKATTIKGKMFAVDLLFDYWIDCGMLTKRYVVPRPAFKDADMQCILTLSEIDQLYNACDFMRERAILSLAYGCGLRRSEIELLNVSDFRVRENLIIVREGKNLKRREIPLAKKILEDLKVYVYNERQEYLRVGSESSQALLLGDNGRRMSGSMINARLKKIALKTGDPIVIKKNISLHTLRHSIATHLIEEGAGIEFVRQFLGHAMIDTTHYYARKRNMKQRQLLR